ncbi:hypothetical protein QFZ21_003419 [Microbacterium sp. W4I20]|nr:hypothetical protein [Microbacterium sp. W4I20]
MLTAAISSSSVETTTSSIPTAATAARTARSTRGTPPTRCRFLRGTCFDPPRAGMIATVLLAVSSIVISLVSPATLVQPGGVRRWP